MRFKLILDFTYTTPPHEHTQGVCGTGKAGIGKAVTGTALPTPVNDTFHLGKCYFVSFVTFMNTFVTFANVSTRDYLLKNCM